MIQLQAIGHLGRDCTVNQTNGKSVINFSVAHSEKYTDKNGVQAQKTIWVNCSWWIDRTNVAQYLKKGTMVWVEGQPEVSTYKNRDGQWAAELKCRVSKVQLLGSSERREEGIGQTYEPVGNPSITNTDADDDLPF